MSNHKWLLDAGHGGMKDGVYTTAPAKMHTFDDGLVIYEGVNNRAIVNRLLPLLQAAAIDFERVYHEQIDTPLAARVKVANDMFRTDKRCIYLSIHSDAMPDGSHGKASGFTVYTSLGQTTSDKIATTFWQTYKDAFPDFKHRQDITDGDPDKEENFYVLRKTACPSVLIENLFFDNRKEAEFLMSAAGQGRIAKALLDAILIVEAAAGPKMQTGLQDIDG